MSDFNVRADSVNVEQVMEQIRARIREKRGADYTEEQIRELATVKLEKFLDPRGVRSDLLEQFRKARPPQPQPELPNYTFEAHTLFDSTRGPLRAIRRLLLPILKLFFNPNPLIQALNIQSRLNAIHAEREAHREAVAHSIDQLQYEVLHNIVLEMTRMAIDVKNLKMRVESLASRLEFNERRARALESVVVYKPAEERADRRDQREPRDRDAREREPREFRDREPRAASEPRGPRETAAPAETRDPRPAAEAPPPGGDANAPAAAAEGPGQRSRRRRRRRGRRGAGSAAAVMGGAAPDGASVVDQRITRPEPFERTFGAEAHPAEPAAGDPGRGPMFTPAAPLAPATLGPPAPPRDAAADTASTDHAPPRENGPATRDNDGDDRNDDDQ